MGTWRLMRDADIQLLASSLAFGTVISLVPLLAVSLSVLNALDGFESLLKKIEPFILKNFVESSGVQISVGIRKAVGRIHSGTLGLTAAIGLVLASTKIFHDMETAVQRVWKIKRGRSVLRRLSIYWIVIFTAPLVLAATLALLGSRDLGLKGTVSNDTIALGFVVLSLAFIYKFVPACPVRWKSALMSAVVASSVIVVAKDSYAGLTKNILRYNKIYGSLASVPIFLLWVLLLWWICLAGAALCATLEGRGGGNEDDERGQG